MAINSKYHVNNKTGRAGQCRATKKGCPLGADTPHFETKEGAQKFIEKSETLKNNKFSTMTKKTQSKKMGNFKSKEQEEYYNGLSSQDKKYYRKVYEDNPNFSDRHLVAANEVIIRNMSNGERSMFWGHDTYEREVILDEMRENSSDYTTAWNKLVEEDIKNDTNIFIN